MSHKREIEAQMFKQHQPIKSEQHSQICIYKIYRNNLMASDRSVGLLQVMENELS